jgi:hypothetical protein
MIVFIGIFLHLRISLRYGVITLRRIRHPVNAFAEGCGTARMTERGRFNGFVG